MSGSPCPQPDHARRPQHPPEPTDRREPWLERALTLIPIAVAGVVLTVSAADPPQHETLAYSLRFGGVNQVSIRYNRTGPHLNISPVRAIWTGAGAATSCSDPPCDGVDSLFFTPRGGLVVANWQNSSVWVFDPIGKDLVRAGPVGPVYNNTFHLRPHPNRQDFFITSFSGQASCPTNCSKQGGRFGVASHSPLLPGVACIAPPEATTGVGLEPVSFAFDAAGNGFAVVSDGRDCAECPSGSGIQFGGGGFAAFDPGLTNSTFCDPQMTLRELIPQEIPAAHSLVYDPFLSRLNGSAGLNITAPHSDFLLFASTLVSHVRVDSPGALNATATVLSSVDLSRNPCSLLPTDAELGEGAVTGSGQVLMGDRVTGTLVLLDYSENRNGTLLDLETVCVAGLLEPGIDAIAPLRGPGSPQIFGDRFESGDIAAWSRSHP